MTPRLGLAAVPPGLSAAWRIFMLINAMFALLILSVVIYTGSFTSDWQKGVTALQFFVLLPLPMIAGAHLVQSRRVLMSRAAPLATWRKEVRDVCRTLFMAWVIASGCSLALALMLRTTAAELDESIAYSGLSATYMGLLTLMAAPQLGLRNWRWLIGIAPMLLAFGLDAAGHTFSDLKRAPWSMWVVGTVLLSTTLVFLYRRTLAPLKVGTEKARHSNQAWTQRITDWFRLPLIDPTQQPYVLLPMLLAGYLPFAFTTDANTLLSTLGGDVTTWNVVRVLLLTVYAGIFLCSRDLHWRNLLAPGGVFRRRLGLRIVITTLASVARLTAVVLCALFLLGWLLSRFVPHAQLTLGWSASVPIALEVLLAVSLAALIRGYSTASGKRIALMSSVFLIATMSATIGAGWLTFSRTSPTFGVVGPSYLVALLTLTALCTAGANRVWARADLASLWRTQQNSEALPDRGW